MVKSKILRFILIIVGFISLGLGVVGIILPIIPTVPFLLLTSFCFLKSSEKFNNWFLNSKIYKKHLEGFVMHRVMTLKGELILLLVVSFMLITSMIFINKPIMTIVFSILILCKYSYFIFRVKAVSKKEYLEIKGENYAR